MKRIRNIGNYVICQASANDKKNICTSDYLLFLKDEMQYSPMMRNIEFEANSVQELIDFVGTGPFFPLDKQIELFKSFINKESKKPYFSKGDAMKYAIKYFNDYKGVFNLLSIINSVDSSDIK